ncbi:MAG: efflux RND transporter permease subunit [Comamonadaceae bacterium]|nr:efflux RND transporter permease subunit [Comamonadaceae bacterium]
MVIVADGAGSVRARRRCSTGARGRRPDRDPVGTGGGAEGGGVGPVPDRLRGQPAAAPWRASTCAGRRRQPAPRGAGARQACDDRWTRRPGTHQAQPRSGAVARHGRRMTMSFKVDPPALLRGIARPGQASSSTSTSAATTTSWSSSCPRARSTVSGAAAMIADADPLVDRTTASWCCWPRLIARRLRACARCARTPVDALPDLSDVQVIIRTTYPGQAPQVVEDQVTYPLTTTHAVGAGRQGGARLLVLRRLLRLRAVRGRHRPVLGALAGARVPEPGRRRGCRRGVRPALGPGRHRRRLDLPVRAGRPQRPPRPRAAARAAGLVPASTSCRRVPDVAEVATVGGMVQAVPGGGRPGPAARLRPAARRR